MLLVGECGDAWESAARDVVDVVRVQNYVTEAFGISPAGASLVRPDGFVAWRSETDQDDPRAALREALARSLCSD